MYGCTKKQSGRKALKGKLKNLQSSFCRKYQGKRGNVVAACGRGATESMQLMSGEGVRFRSGIDQALGLDSKKRALEKKEAASEEKRREAAAKVAQEKQRKEAAEKASREEKQRKEAAEKVAREEKEQKEAAEKAAREEKQRKEAAAREEKQRKEAAEKAAREEKQRKEAAEKAAREEKQRKEAAEKAARDEKQRKEAAEKAAREEKQRKEAAEKAAREEKQRKEAAEKASREEKQRKEAAKMAKQRKEAAEKARLEKEAAEDGAGSSCSATGECPAEAEEPFTCSSLSFCDSCYFDSNDQHCTWCIGQSKCVATSEVALGMTQCDGQLLENMDRGLCAAKHVPVKFHYGDDTPDAKFDVSINHPATGSVFYGDKTFIKVSITSRGGSAVVGDEKMCLNLTSASSASSGCFLISELGADNMPTLTFGDRGVYALWTWVENGKGEKLSPRASSYFDAAPRLWKQLDVVRGAIATSGPDFASFKQIADSTPAIAQMGSILRGMASGELKKLFSAHAVLGASLSENIHAVPKKIHQVWMQGAGDLERLEKEDDGIKKHFLRWTKTWKYAHPTWEYKLWDERSISDLVHSDPLLKWAAPTYDSYDHFIKKVDFARYLLLFRFGGVALDVDFECLGPLDEILKGSTVIVAEEEPKKLDENGNARMLTIAGQSLAWSSNNAFMASSAMHPFWLLTACEAMRRNGIDSHMHVLKSTGPVLLTQVVDLYHSMYGSDSVKVLDRMLFFPLSIEGKAWNERHRCIVEDNCQETFKDSLAIHHFSQSWLADYETTVFFKATSA